ncbi:MAG: DegV family EDD domain-containing protein [Chloroflexi bacterium]|nr:DegV family EDD domain-containing protein [Chloroflexota bacterium]
MVTDSMGSVPPELVSKLKIHIIPVNLIIEGKIYQDGLDITPVEFYNRLKEIKVLPTTSAPPPGTFSNKFTELSKQTKSIFCVTISSKISAVYDAAYQAIALAKKSLPDTDIRLFDSLTAGGAEGFITIAAAKAAAQGANLDQVTKVAEQVREKIYQCSMLDTLTYLARGGRISKTAARKYI